MVEPKVTLEQGDFAFRLLGACLDFVDDYTPWSLPDHVWLCLIFFPMFQSPLVGVLARLVARKLVAYQASN